MKTIDQIDAVSIARALMAIDKPVRVFAGKIPLHGWENELENGGENASSYWEIYLDVPTRCFPEKWIGPFRAIDAFMLMSFNDIGTLFAREYLLEWQKKHMTPEEKEWLEVIESKAFLRIAKKMYSDAWRAICSKNPKDADLVFLSRLMLSDIVEITAMLLPHNQFAQKQAQPGCSTPGQITMADWPFL